MSEQNKKRNLVFEEKNNNINLISMEKSPNKNIKINYAKENKENNDFNNKSNNLSIINSKKNDLLNSKMEEESIFSIMNVEEEQKHRNYADFLFTEEDEKGNISQIKNKSINNKSINNLNHNDSSKDNSISVSIDEGKKIAFANKLFDESLNSSMKNNTINDMSLSLISEKRKEFADKLFESNSDISLKKKSLNETIKSFKSNQSNMSHAINNLSGSNAGLNINAFANKCTNIDNVINENEIESSMYKIKANENNNSITKSFNDYGNIDEQMENEIHFKNLIDINRGSEINKSNNLKDISNSIIKDKNDNSLIKSSQKIGLVSDSKEIKNNNKILGVQNDSKKKIINPDEKENNENNISNSELSISNIIIDGLPKKENKIEENKKIIIDESMQKEKDDKNIKKNKKKVPIKKNPLDIFKKKNNKLKKEEERKVEIIEKDLEEETSNEILNKKIGIDKNENNDSSFLKNIPSRISIEDDKNDNKLNNKRSINSKHKKKQLIIERFPQKDTIETENLIKEKKENKSIKLQKKLSNEYEDDFKNEDEEEEEEFKQSKRSKNNIIKIDKDEIGPNLFYFNDKNLNTEKSYRNFLKEKKLFYNEKIYNSMKTI